MKLNLQFVLVFFASYIINAQETTNISLAPKKKLTAFKTSNSITIDGKLNESEWSTAETASDFIMFEPDNGKPLVNEKRTEVKVLYDNDGIYIGAAMYDDPQKILKEITERDNFGTSDFFGIFVNGYNDGQQDFRFFVSAAGTQMDALATEGNEDYSWDGIWNSGVSITDFGWVAEMKIPYAALRFAEKEEQVWGVNFFREIRRDRQKFTWNHINNKIGTVIQQAGIVEGIKNIQPPTRLFFIPYSSYYLSTNKKGTENKFKAGMDLKYGINDSFTLDAILVPDFGQTTFDNVVLNLGPFEQQFNENRPFFTEGTDLFNKGNLFYSRRIGAEPSTYPSTTDDEEVVDYPAAVNLINALKISGRTSKGLGIGVLNAVTEKTDVTIRNRNTGESRSETVEPLTNYNVLVLDQRFRKNSSVTFVNTNVTRNCEFRDANVSAVLFDLNTKANTYKLSGNFKFSHVNEIAEDLNGYTGYLNFSKTSGKYRFTVNSTYVSNKYDINDMGIMFINNYHNIYANVNYRILNANKTFNSFNINTNYYAEFQNVTGRAQEAYINVNVNTTNKKNHYIGGGLQVSPFETYDFYQPRQEGRYSYNPKAYSGWFDISTNYNNPFALDTGMWYDRYNQDIRHNIGFYFSPRYRFSDKFALIYYLQHNRQNADKGWVDYDSVNDEIIYSNRDRNTIENTLTGKFSLNHKMTFNLKARYYWSYTENLNFLTLKEDGHFEDNTTYDQDQNNNFKIWNFDLTYSWWFAPGSQISVLYRNNATHFERRVNKNIIDNLNNTLSNDLNNIFSVSVRYYIDYNQAKSWVKKV
ncbi:DUF5916 domain-containing protein [Flavobacterium sp.]|uniref:DUF5916 domain-containing protein n=1 Tax=Flavobacterium sp. TaxID=239 RepID=UPI0028BE2D32|nr:DUF5916 domain-containing protein [Flavobacterium sp.]